MAKTYGFYSASQQEHSRAFVYGTSEGGRVIVTDLSDDPEYHLSSAIKDLKPMGEITGPFLEDLPPLASEDIQDMELGFKLKLKLDIRAMEKLFKQPRFAFWSQKQFELCGIKHVYKGKDGQEIWATDVRYDPDFATSPENTLYDDMKLVGEIDGWLIRTERRDPFATSPEDLARWGNALEEFDEYYLKLKEQKVDPLAGETSDVSATVENPESEGPEV